jgi:hypothetical protein
MLFCLQGGKIISAGGVAIGQQTIEFRAVTEKEPSRRKHHAQRQQPQCHPRTAPAYLGDQPIAERGIDEQADGKALPGDAHHQAAAAHKPLRDHCVADQLHRAKAEEAHNQKETQERPRPAELREQHNGKAKTQRINNDHAPRAKAVDQPPGDGQHKGGCQRGKAIEQGDDRARNAQVSHHRVNKEAEGKGLAWPHHHNAQHPGQENNPAIKEGHRADYAAVARRQGRRDRSSGCNSSRCCSRRRGRGGHR